MFVLKIHIHLVDLWVSVCPSGSDSAWHQHVDSLDGIGHLLQVSQICRNVGKMCHCLYIWIVMSTHTHMYAHMLYAFIHAYALIPECVARVPVSLWGCGGRAVFAATVRNRSREDRLAVPMDAYGKFCKRGHFWRFPASRSFISRGRRGTSRHSNMFQDMSKNVKNRFVWQAQYFRDVFRRCVAFFVAGAALWTPTMSFCVASAAL